MSESKEQQLEARIRQLEEQLERSQGVSSEELAELRGYRDMFEGTVAMLLIDADGAVLRVNAGASELTGFSREELVSRPGLEIVVPDERLCFIEDMQDTLKIGPVRRDYSILHADGHGIYVEVRFYPGVVEKKPAVFVMVVDAAECRLSRCRRFQKEQADAVGKLAEGTAHQINNLLARIMACAEDADLNNIDPRSAKGLRTIVDACEEASVITESLLSYAGRHMLRRRLVNPVKILEHTLQMCEEQLAGSGIDVVRDYGEVPSMLIDNVLMGKAFRRIIDNAIQAMPQGGHLTVSCRTEDEFVRIKVADTGCGIDPKMLPLIFLPFVTTKGVLSGSELPGMGLGLSMVRGVIAGHYGEVSVESAIGLGTAILMILPVDQSSRESANGGDFG